MEHVSLDLHAAIPVGVATDGAVLAFSPFSEGQQWFATSPTVIVAAPSEGDARGMFAMTRVATP